MTRDILAFYNLVSHSGEDITRGKAQAVGLLSARTWNASEKLSRARVMRHAVLKSTETSGGRCTERVYVHLVRTFR